MHGGTYLGDHRVLTQTRDGIRFFLDTRDIILTPIVLCNGSWEPEVVGVIDALLKPGMHFVDVGANMGWFTCQAAARVLPGGKVTAFEADPELFRLLSDNVALNWHFDGVELHELAAYRETAELTFYKRGKYQGNSSIGSVPDEDIAVLGDSQIPIRVNAVALDDVIRDPVHLMKIDVEGAEPFVLEGMRKLVAEQPDIKLLIEWSPGQLGHAGRSPQELLDLLAGWKKFRVTDELVEIRDTDLLASSHCMMFLEKG